MSSRPLLSGFEKLALFAVVLILGYYAMGRYGKRKPSTLKEKVAYSAENLGERLKKTKENLSELAKRPEDEPTANVAVTLEQIAEKFSKTGIKKHIRQEETVDNLMDWGLSEEEARFYAKLQQRFTGDTNQEERSEADWLSILQAGSKSYDKIKHTLDEVNNEEKETLSDLIEK
jgi:hypothetical protein